jgi:uncharacterized membrane protein YhaH (DUF805 family)
MSKNTFIRAAFAILIIVIGNLQAWDSDVPQAGLMIVLLTSLAIALPAVALLIPLSRGQFLGIFALSFLLLFIARMVSPIALSGLFLVLIPAVMGLIFTGLFEPKPENTTGHQSDRDS